MICRSLILLLLTLVVLATAGGCAGVSVRGEHAVGIGMGSR